MHLPSAVFQRKELCQRVAEAAILAVDLRDHKRSWLAGSIPVSLLGSVMADGPNARWTSTISLRPPTAHRMIPRNRLP